MRKLHCLQAAAVALIAGAAALHPTTGFSASAPETEVGPTAAGNYLAGRHAQFERRTAAAADFYLAALKDEPDNQDLLRRTFLILAADGRVGDSLPLARRLLKLAGTDAALAVMTVGIAELADGDPAAAQEHFESLPNTGLNTFFLPLVKAWLLAGEKKYDEALAELDGKATNSGLEILYSTHMALINEVAGNAAAAGEAYKAAAGKRQRTNLRLTQLQGEFLERAGQKESAKAAYDAYMAEHPNSTVLEGSLKRLDGGPKPPVRVKTAREGVAEALFSLAGSIRQQDSFETMLYARLALHLKPRMDIAKLLVAEVLEGDERLAESNAVYRQIGRTSGFSWSARLRIASNLDRLDKTEQAVLELRSLAQERQDRYDALVSMGDIFRRRERYREAADAYADARARIPSLEPRHWTLLYAIGIAHERLKEWPKAEPAFLKALELQPDQPFVLNYLGYSWVELGKNLDRAKGMIETAVEKRPTDGYIVDSLGWVLYRLGDLPGAVRNLERAVELRPEDPTINDHLGDVYWLVGRKNEARFQWQRSLILEPEKDLEAKIKDKLENGFDPEKHGKPAGN